MTTQVAGTSVSTSIIVEAPIAHAFTVFTDQIGSWWPSDHHIIEGELAEMVFEPRVGGNLYDRTTDGTECRWSRVLAYDPPNRVVFSWDVSMQWQVETDTGRTSEVEVTFVAEGPDRTRVVLEHRNLERHGEGWESMRAAVSSTDGWERGMLAFAAAAAA